MTTATAIADTMTLREAFEEFNRPDLTNAGTIAGYRHDLNRWERLTDNPPVGQITNRTLADFRDACLDAGLAPSSFNGTRTMIRAVLRRIGPQEYRNPLGEGIIDRVPYVKPLPEDLPIPRIYSLPELSAIYDACDVARAPRGEVPAADWWRAMLVIGFNLIPRRGDVSHLRTESVNWDDGLIRWTARKTRKRHVLPMNAVVQAHLQRIWSDREFVFPRQDGGAPTDNSWRQYYATFHAIAAAAGVDAPAKPLQALRRTGASFLESTVPGIANIIGGWGLKGVAANYYLNPVATGDVARATNNLPQPEAFLRILRPAAPVKSILDRQTPVKATEWEFTAESATWKGTTLRFRDRSGRRVLRVLQLLVTAKRPLTFADFQSLAWWEGDVTRQTIKGLLHRLRKKLIAELQLPPLFDPIANARDGEGYFLKLP